MLGVGRGVRTEDRPAILHDPHWTPKSRQGLVRVRVTSTLLYLDGKFHVAGAEVSVPTFEAEQAVLQRMAAWVDAPEADPA